MHAQILTHEILWFLHSQCTLWMRQPWTFPLAVVNCLWMFCGRCEKKCCFAFKSHCHLSSLLCCSHFKMQFTTRGGAQIKYSLSVSLSFTLSLSVCLFHRNFSIQSDKHQNSSTFSFERFSFVFCFCLVSHQHNFNFHIEITEFFVLTPETEKNFIHFLKQKWTQHRGEIKKNSLKCFLSFAFICS